MTPRCTRPGRPRWACRVDTSHRLARPSCPALTAVSEPRRRSSLDSIGSGAVQAPPSESKPVRSARAAGRDPRARQRIGKQHRRLDSRTPALPADAPAAVEPDLRWPGAWAAGLRLALARATDRGAQSCASCSCRRRSQLREPAGTPARSRCSARRSSRPWPVAGPNLSMSPRRPRAATAKATVPKARPTARAKRRRTEVSQPPRLPRARRRDRRGSGEGAIAQPKAPVTRRPRRSRSRSCSPSSGPTKPRRSYLPFLSEPAPVIAAAPSASSPRDRDAGASRCRRCRAGAIDAARARAVELAKLDRSEQEAQQQAAQLEAERIETARQEADRQEAARQAAAHEVARQEAERQEAARQADRRRAGRQAARQEATRQEAQRVEDARQEAERQEAERQAAARQDAARQEAARQDAQRVEAARQEAERQEAARQAAAREEAARQEAARQDAQRVEAARLEAERQEAARQRQRQARLSGTRMRDRRREPRQEAAREAAQAGGSPAGGGAGRGRTRGDGKTGSGASRDRTTAG